MDLCRFSSKKMSRSNSNSAALLLGIPESERFSGVYRQLPDLQLVDNGLLTTSYERLLSSRDPNVEVYV